MELRHLRYFVAAAEEENFHRASERLHVTQPALSRRIRDLEAELDVALFERKQRRVTLTDAGRAYFEDAKHTLQMLDQAADRARRVAQGESGNLSIGINDSVVRHPIVPRALQTFAERFRDVGLKLDSRVRPSMVEAVVQGHLDAAFLYSRPATDPALEHVAIASDRYLIALPSKHPLAERSDLRLANLQGEDFLWLRRETAPSLHDEVIAACRAGGLTPRITQHVTSEGTRLQLVAAGMGLTFVTSSWHEEMPGVVIRPIIDFDATLHLDLAWRRDKETPVLRRFVEVVVELTKAEPPERPG